jgi:hypothetical protein
LLPPDKHLFSSNLSQALHTLVQGSLVTEAKVGARFPTFRPSRSMMRSKNAFVPALDGHDIATVCAIPHRP